MHLQSDDGNGHIANCNNFDVLSKLPALGAPDLLPESDSGMSAADNITNHDNSDPTRNLKFTVGSCFAGATENIMPLSVSIAKISKSKYSTSKFS